MGQIFSFSRGCFFKLIGSILIKFLTIKTFSFLFLKVVGERESKNQNFCLSPFCAFLLYFQKKKTLKSSVVITSKRFKIVYKNLINWVNFSDLIVSHLRISLDFGSGSKEGLAKLHFNLPILRHWNKEQSK